MLETPHRPFGPPPHVVGRRIRCSKRPTGPSGHLPTWWGGEVEDRGAPPALRATSPHGGEAKLKTVTPHRPFGPPPHVVGRRIRCSKRPTGPSGHLPTWWGGEVEDRGAPPALRATSPHGGEAKLKTVTPHRPFGPPPHM